MYQTLTNKPIIIKEIHLGGGTPTFFSAANLAFLINSITEGCEISSNHEFSIEIHPNYTTYQQLEVLSKLGYNRISIGIQDFDPTVQFIINRIQTYEQTAMVVNWARELNFESINFDIIYGLPLQTLSIIEQTIEKVMTLHPDRIAFYSYAHVPWKSKGQRRYSEIDLPSGNQKMAMYNLVYKKLTEKGYKSIGMDHFALQSDKLWQAYLEGNLHRNFMGYTTTNHKLVIGLGASSISDTWTAFAQNEKTPELYMEKINKGIFPIIDGHLLDAQDLSTRQHILNLMCKGITYIDTTSLPNFEQAKYTLEEMENDGLIEWNRDYILVLEKGKLLIRNICSVLDLYLLKNDINKYSRAI
jgi:oxygen-independent coproporphyrinogen-3 oxidase